MRPAITFVIFASGLKYVGVGTTKLGWTLGVVLLAAALFWLLYERPRQIAARAAEQSVDALEPPPSTPQPAGIP